MNSSCAYAGAAGEAYLVGAPHPWRKDSDGQECSSCSDSIMEDAGDAVINIGQ